MRFFLFVLFFATPCVAQEIPAWEFFGGYSFQRSNVREYYKSTPIIFSVRNQYADLNGFDAAVTENMNRWFGGTLDFGGHFGSPQLLGTTSREQRYSILYGPRFSYRRPWGIPFAHILLGAAHTGVKVTPTGPHASANSFAVAAGGGLDVHLGRKVAIRVFQAEYFRTGALGTRPNSYRASAGVVLFR